MKKIASFLIVILSVLMFTLAGCSQSQSQEYMKIELTAENYTEYISINLYYIDYQIISSQEDDFGTIIYTVNQTIGVETSKRIDIQFENATISYTPNSESLRGNIEATLDINGNSKSSFTRFIGYAFAELPHLGNHLLENITFEGSILMPVED